MKIVMSYRKVNFYKKYKRICEKYLCKILYTTKIVEGLYLGHAVGIIINPHAIISKNVNIAQDVTVGQENGGKRKGTPTIGDKVWIGANAVIVENIKIGNAVLIATNSYVNFDVPDHSIVIGNPGKIIPREMLRKGI